MGARSACGGSPEPLGGWWRRGRRSAPRGAPESKHEAEPATPEVEDVDRRVDPEEEIERTGDREDPDVARIVVEEAEERRDLVRHEGDAGTRSLLFDCLVVGRHR